jgi:hypothetical protein
MAFQSGRRCERMRRANAALRPEPVEARSLVRVRGERLLVPHGVSAELFADNFGRAGNQTPLWPSGCGPSGRYFARPGNSSARGAAADPRWVTRFACRRLRTFAGPWRAVPRLRRLHCQAAVHAAADIAKSIAPSLASWTVNPSREARTMVAGQRSGRPALRPPAGEPCGRSSRESRRVGPGSGRA